MTCKNCGTQIPENENKCPKCGTPVNAEETNISAAGAERAVPRGFSAKKNIIIIIIAAILLIGGGITAIAMANSHSASSGVSESLKLAERYLSEQNYEQAVIEFQKILEIEPMNADAYLGLADVYLALNQTDKALDVLREGLEKTGDNHIKSKLDELTKKPETSSSASSAVSSEPTVSSTSTSAETKPVVTEPPIESVTTSTVDINDETPFLQKYWVIFTEGYRNNRVEASTINSSLSADKLTLIWDSALELNNTSGSDSCDQYYLDENDNWVYIGSYHRLTDYATNVIASNLDVVDRDGNVIVSKSLYSTVGWDEINRYR